MTAVFRRELSAYFRSPIGYIFIAVFYIFAGFYFFAGTLLSNTTNVSIVFSGLFNIVMFLIPILTMRLMSEDNKHRTDQALLTAPISLTGLVLGKFLAACAVYLISLGITLVFGLVINVFNQPNWAMLLGNFVAMLLLGMAFISIGLFISSLTENQVIAAVGSFAVSLALLIIDSLTSLISNPWLLSIVSGISFFNRYSVFTSGIFDFSSLFFFLSVCAIFIFLTVRVLEKRRWS